MNEPTAPLAVAIVVFTTLVSLGGLASPVLVERLLFAPVPILRRGEWHRIVTSGFLHANWVHLFVNMFSFYSFGSSLESRYGAAALGAIYFSGVVGGNLVSLFLHHDEIGYRALGASGGVCGVIFADIFLIPGTGVYLFPLPIPIPSAIFAVVFIFISFFGMRARWGNIGHDAHLGGAVIGLAVATLLHPRIISENPVLWAVVMGLSLGLFVYLARGARFRPRNSVSFLDEYERTGRWPWRR